MSNDLLGDRMKNYEDCSRMVLTRRMPVIVRLDGKAFHTYTRGFEKPWDENIKACLTKAAFALMERIQGSKIAYLQSDEISILITDYDSLTSEPWFRKQVQKISSVSSSIATCYFNGEMVKRRENKGNALFDARTFVIPKEDVSNYFLWRQKDAIRNSIQGLGQSFFSHKHLHKVSIGQIKKNLKNIYNIDWDQYDTWKKLGWCVLRGEADESGRKPLTIDENIPDFMEDRHYIEKHVFLEES